MLESLVSRAKTFTNDIGKAGVIDKNRGVINRTIDEVLAAIRGNVSNMNLLSNQVKKKYPKFVENYFKSAAIDYSNIHHSGIKGMITNSNNGAVVEGVTLTLQGIKKTKTAITSIDGAYEIIKFLSGKAKLTITAPGYDSQTVEVDIIRGKIIELNYSIQSQILEFKTA